MCDRVTHSNGLILVIKMFRGENVCKFELHLESILMVDEIERRTESECGALKKVKLRVVFSLGGCWIVCQLQLYARNRCNR